MATISRLKDAEITSGQTASAADVDAELDQLVNEHNSKETRLDNLETNAMTIAGAKTFTSNILINGIDERSAGSGVTVDGVVLKDSKVKPSSASPTMAEGEIGYDTATNTYKGHNGTSEITFLSSNAAWPKDFLTGPPIEYVSTTQVRIPADFKCRDDSDDSNIEFTSAETIDITTTTGAAVVNALMNGLTENSDTWYYVWAIAKANGAEPKGILTTSSSTITTMPTDYTLKRRIGVVRNDGSSNFIPFDIVGNFYQYNVFLGRAGATAGTTNVLDGGTATTYTDVDCSDFIPSISEKGYFKVSTPTSGIVNVRPDGESHDGFELITNDSATTDAWVFPMKTSGSQLIEYKININSVDIDIVGFYITDFA